MTILFYITMFIAAASPQSSSHKSSRPIETQLCQIIQSPAAFDGKLVRFRAEFMTDHIERSILIDKACRDSGGILPYEANEDIPGGKSFEDATQIRNPTTLDQTLLITITGIFHYNAKPEMCMFLNKEQCKRSIAMTRIQDLTLTTKPKR